jgi:D-alanine-D-alanine ligase
MAENEIPFPAYAAGKIGIICNLKHADHAAQNSANPEAEYDSIETVRAIQSALTKHGLHVCIVEQDEDLAAKLRTNGVTMAFNIAEGRGGRGREAQIPALLEYLGIPYTGSDPVALGISLDKTVTKKLAAAAGVRVAVSALFHTGKETIPEGLTYPVLVKPDAEGSGKGVSEHCVAENEAELRGILADECPENPDGMLVEQFLPGREFTVAMIGNGAKLHVFPPMEIVYHHSTQRDYKVYSYKVKCNYSAHVDYQCPAAVTPAQAQEMTVAAEKVFRELGCRDVARVDFHMDAAGRICFLEINPLPGLAPGYSDLPMITEASGMSYEDTVFAVYKAAAERLGAVSEPGGSEADSRDDWHWQFRNRICSAEALAEHLPLTVQEMDAIEQVCKSFRMAVTPYYLSLINQADPDDPIRKMCVPSIQETMPCENDRTDPLNEDASSPVPHIVHRYPDRCCSW